MSDVREAMAVGHARYADAIDELGRRLGPATFTQTGGMCAALQVTLERGYLLVTDSEDSLPWDRRELAGWGVGYYFTDDVGEGPEVFVDRDDTSISALLDAAEQCLHEAATSLRTHRTP